MSQPKPGAGYPLVVTVKVPDAPAVKVVVLALVKAGAWPTTSVKAWVAFGVIPLAAVMVRVVVPVAVGVPESSAVPLALSVKVSPAGRVPALADGRGGRARGGDGEGPGLAQGEVGCGRCW